MHKKSSKHECLQLEGSNFRLGGIAPISWAVPPFRVLMRLAVSVAWQSSQSILFPSFPYLLSDKFRSKHRKRVPFSENLPVCAMACRTDSACWEVSQTLLKTLSLPTTPHRAFLTKF